MPLHAKLITVYVIYGVMSAYRVTIKRVIFWVMANLAHYKNVELQVYKGICLVAVILLFLSFSLSILTTFELLKH